MLIRVSKGKTYRKVLGKLRKELNLDTLGSKVVSAKATQKGDVLLLLDRGSNNEGFTEEVKSVVEGLGEDRADPRKINLDIRDLDPVATGER